MAGDPKNNAWPLPAAHFSVDIEGLAEGLVFQAVSGLTEAAETTERRAGPMRLSGLNTPAVVALQGGLLPYDNKLRDWYQSSLTQAITRRTVTIWLLDTNDARIRGWKLINAWPSKLSSTSSSRPEISVYDVQFAHEGIEVMHV